MSAVVRRFTDYAFADYRLNRIYANVFAWNQASARVLEKADTFRGPAAERRREGRPGGGQPDVRHGPDLQPDGGPGRPA